MEAINSIDIIYEILKWIKPQNLHIYKRISKRFYYIVGDVIRNKNKYYIYYIKNYITPSLFDNLSSINSKYNFNIMDDILIVYNYIKNTLNGTLDRNKDNVFIDAVSDKLELEIIIT